jgi:hypothetical protein
VVAVKPDDQRRATLRAALVALRIQQDEPELRLVHRLLDNWSGIGLLAVGMHRQGLRLSLSHVADGEWRCVFTGENALLATRGFGVAPTPWVAGAEGGVGGAHMVEREDEVIA